MGDGKLMQLLNISWRRGSYNVYSRTSEQCEGGGGGEEEHFVIWTFTHGRREFREMFKQLLAERGDMKIHIYLKNAAFDDMNSYEQLTIWTLKNIVS